MESHESATSVSIALVCTSLSNGLVCQVMSHIKTSNRRRSQAILAIQMTLLGLIGCQTASPGRSAPTQSDRLMNAYPELRGGRFALIADFEDQKQMQVVQVISVSDDAYCGLSSRGGRSATGAGSLMFTAGSNDDTVIIANKGGQSWYLKRDWRAYDLLLLSVDSPEDSLSLSVSISGGEADQRSTIFTNVPLDRGWNVLRLDLAEVGERVPLDDVREIRLNIKGTSTAVTLAIDDLVLTGHRESVFGDPTNTKGELYVQQVGRRIHIGAGGKFELTVGNGQIRAWHNLGDDPNRLRNLLYESSLGPNPVEINKSKAKPLSGLGETVVASHRILEANGVRVVLECEWRFVDDPSRARAGLDAAPFHRWRYTIYPTGQLYVLVESTSKTDDGWSPQIGLSVALASPSPGGIQTFIPQVQSQDPDPITETDPNPDYNPNENSDRDAPMFASLSNAAANAEFLFVPNLRAATSRFDEVVSMDGRSVTINAQDKRDDSPVKSWVSHIHLSQEATDLTKEARARAIDVAGVRSPVRIERGAPIESSVGIGRSDGFNAAEGCYAISPDAGRLRVVIEGGNRPIFSPSFCIPFEKGRESWVYVDHLTFHPVVTNERGQLIFQIPGVIEKKSEIEVLFRRPDPTRSP